MNNQKIDLITLTENVHYQMNNQKIDLITLTENVFLISQSDGNKYAETHELTELVNKREYKEDRWKYRRTLDYIKEKLDPFTLDHRTVYCKNTTNKKLFNAMKYARYLEKNKKINNLDEILSRKGNEIQKESENKLKSKKH
uniref:DUF771 domain-containing protein n=1 Tax=Strongyloides papillosus TaxID=174720 RepID=A0A0N5CID0_STREA